MLSSKLDKIITLEKYTSYRDTYNLQKENYVKVKDLYATVRIKDGGLENGETGDYVKVFVDFTVRYTPELNVDKSKYRIKYNNDYYRIDFIQEIGRKEGFIIKTILYEDE